MRVVTPWVTPLGTRFEPGEFPALIGKRIAFQHPGTGKGMTGVLDDVAEMRQRIVLELSNVRADADDEGE